MRGNFVSVVISQDEVRAAYYRNNDNATIEYIRLIPSYYADRLDPSVEELAAWTTANKTAIGEYFENNKFRYTNLEKQVRARHILLKVSEDATDEERLPDGPKWRPCSPAPEPEKTSSPWPASPAKTKGPPSRVVIWDSIPADEWSPNSTR